MTLPLLVGLAIIATALAGTRYLVVRMGADGRAERAMITVVTGAIIVTAVAVPIAVAWGYAATHRIPLN